jgi:hypothetical protein
MPESVGGRRGAVPGEGARIELCAEGWRRGIGRPWARVLGVLRTRCDGELGVRDEGGKKEFALF